MNISMTLDRLACTKGSKALIGVVVACAALMSCNAFAVEPSPDPSPLLTKPGKVLFSDDLGQTPVNPQSHLGKWEIKEGVLVGSEKPEEKHGAVLRRTKLSFRDAAVQVSFRLDGAKGISMGIINAKGHVAAVRVTATSLQLNRSLESGDKSEVLDTVPLKLQAGVWYTLLLETRGKEIAASIDGKQAAFGLHEKIDVDKTIVRLLVAGESAAFQNLRVREATASDTWETTKAKLLEARKK